MAKVKFDFNLSDYTDVILKGEFKESAIEDVTNFVKEAVLKDVGGGVSPVTGRAFPKYKDPKKYPGKEKRKSPVNLELSGDMLDSLSVDQLSGTKIRLTVSEDQMPKADNHNKFSAKSQDTGVPARKFIPNAANGENFKPEIRKRIEQIISSYVDEQESEEEPDGEV